MKNYKIALVLPFVALLVGSAVTRETVAQPTTEVTSYKAPVVETSTTTTTEAPKPVETIPEAPQRVPEPQKKAPAAPQGCWMELAAQIGWPADTLANLNYIINRESGCDPTAYNGKGLDRSYGLLQINTITPLWGYVQKTCGINQPEELLNPETNLTCGLRYYEHQGWRPWHT